MVALYGNTFHNISDMVYKNGNSTVFPKFFICQENIKALYYWLFVWGESTGGDWRLSITEE